jgi:alcohol oxidase
MTIPDEVDIIVCGGGSCGCVVAGRLANLDHNLQVLLIEAGENNLNNPWVFRPGIYPRNMKLDSKTATFYYSRPSEWLDGRRNLLQLGLQMNDTDCALDVHPCVSFRLRRLPSQGMDH